MTSPQSRLCVPGAGDDDPPLGYLRLGAYDGGVESGYLPANWADGTGAPTTASQDDSTGIMMMTSGAVVVRGATTAMSFGNGLSIAVSGGAVRFLSADGTFRLAATGMRLSAAKLIDTTSATAGHIAVRAEASRFESGTTLRIDGDDLDTRCDHYNLMVEGKHHVTVKFVSTSVYIGVSAKAYSACQITMAPIFANTAVFALSVSGLSVAVKDRDIQNIVTKSSNEGLKSTLANISLVKLLADVGKSDLYIKLKAMADRRSEVDLPQFDIDLNEGDVENKSSQMILIV